VGALISAKTGTGKTVVALEIARQLGQRTLVLTHTNVIAEQWRKAAKRFLGLTDAEIGTVQGHRCRYDVPLSIGMIQSCMREKYPTAFEEAFGLVIFDEVQHVGAEVFGVVARLFPAKFRIGLSGTMVRRDGLEVVYKDHIGPIIRGAETSSVKPVIYRVDVPWGWSGLPRLYGGGINLARVLTCLAEDDQRTAEVCRYVAKAIEKQRRTLVLTDRLSQVRKIADCLRSMKISGGRVGVLVGSTPQPQREAARNKSVIIATYKIGEEGLDVPDLECLVFATPRANVEQAVGRLLREHPGKRSPAIIDFVDRVSVLERFWAARLRR